MSTTRHGTRVEAVVFDLDGVLVETEELWDEVRRSLASQAGLAWPATATRAMQGMSTPEWSGYLVETVGVPGPASAVAEHVIGALAAAYDKHLPLLPGAVAAVRRLAGRWPLGLASSSPRRLIDAVLHAADLTAQFQVTLSTEEVSAGKPSPEVYVTAVERLGTEAGRTVAIEDSSNGLRAASAAGMVVVALPHRAFPPAPDALALAHGRVDRLDEITPDYLDALAGTGAQ